jgi:predicted HicB family RNase H-like nuclease
MITEVIQEKNQEVYNIANNLYQQKPDWVGFFREVLGIDGIIRQAFPNQDDLAQFEKSREFDDIQLMLAKLREQNGSVPGDKEPTRVITVRLPKSLHESLRTEAHERHTSMNKLCISKLLQIVENALVPADA